MGLPAEQINVDTMEKQAATRLSETEKILAVANDLTISYTADYQSAEYVLRDIKQREKDTEADRKSFTQPLDELKKKIMDRYRPAMDCLTNAKRIIEGKMLAWSREQDRIRREQQAKIEEARRKEEEKLRRQAEKAAEKGNVEKAAALQEQAQTISETPVIVQTTVPKTGTSMRKTWKARVTDKSAFIRSIAEREEFHALVNVDDAALNGMARSLKGNLKLAGVETYKDDTLSTRL